MLLLQWEDRGQLELSDVARDAPKAVETERVKMA
jgi:uncharacterized protein YciU (UPF0263 family)